MLAAEKRTLRKKLGQLKDHERILIKRKRLGNTQNQEAKRLGVSRYKYRKWEKGDLDKDTIVPKRLSNLGIFEICFLLRKRNNLTITKLAQEIGVSKTWICDMELGTAPIGDLVKYWIVRYAKS